MNAIEEIKQIIQSYLDEESGLMQLQFKENDFADFMLWFSVDFQQLISEHESEDNFGKFPTLGEFDKAFSYGELHKVLRSASALFVLRFVNDLAEYCMLSVKDNAFALTRCAFAIARHYAGLKISDAMLIFYRFKVGEYRQYYGLPLTLAIASAFKDYSEEIEYSKE